MRLISIIGALLSSIMLLVTAVFVITKDMIDQFNRYYLFYALGGFGILFTMFLTYFFPESPYLTEINRVTQFSTLMFFASVLTLSMVFPRSDKKFPFRYSLLILLPAIAIAPVLLFTDLSITRAYFENGVLKRDFNPKSFFGLVDFYNIYAVIAISYMLIGSVIFIMKYAKTTVYVYRLQMRYVFVGASFAFMIAAVSSIILPKFFNYSDLYVVGPSFAALFTTLSLFYSVITYNLMDIKTVIHKTTMYTIMSMVIYFPILGIFYLFYNGTSLFSAIPPYVVAGLIVLLFVLFQTYVQPLIDTLFKRRQYEFEDILDTFIRQVEEERDLSEIIARMVDLLYQALELKSAFFIMYDDQSRRYELKYYKGNRKDFTMPPIERSATVIRWFSRNSEPITLNRVYADDRSFADIREDMVGFYNTYGINFILPMYHEKSVLGFLCLGEKDSLSAFTPDEIEELGSFQRRSNDFISTALTYQKAMREQFIARTIGFSSQLLQKAVPRALPNSNSIKFGAFFLPKYAEGVDYFDFLRPGTQGIGAIATDISGIGVNSALYSVLIRSAFHANLSEAPYTYTVMQNINKLIFNYTKGRGGLITAYYLYYDVKNMRLMYTNAGYPALELFRVEKNNFDVLDTEGIPLGYDGTASYGIGKTNLLRGDIGLVYSKTLVTTRNTKGEEFNLSRVRRIVSENRGKSPSDIAVILKNAFTEFLGVSTPVSDVSVLLFKVV